MSFWEKLRGKTSFEECGVLRGKRDSHSHILFGVDDGIKTLENSLLALRRQEEFGLTDVWCTPHVMEDVPNTTVGLRRRFEELLAAYKGPVRLHLGAEYMMDTNYRERLEARDLLLLEEDQVLVETSTRTPPYNMSELLADTLSAGYRPVLAHPERYRYMELEHYHRLREMGILLQINLTSLVGYYGESAKKKAEYLLSNDMVARIGSDCHHPKLFHEAYRRAELSRKMLPHLEKIPY